MNLDENNQEELIQSKSCVLGIGFFDGVHLGHQELIKNVLSIAKEDDLTPIILTFDPQPRMVVNPEQKHQAICSMQQKEEFILAMGINRLVVIPFDLKLAEKTPEEFIAFLLTKNPLIKAICVGENWHFGKNGSGDLSKLKEICLQYDIAVHGVSIKNNEQGVISSTRIREAILSGDLTLAKRLLGRPHCVRGKIVHGRGVGGEQLHCPTANLVDDSLLVPPAGSYAARATIKEIGTHSGIVYVGKCPTFEDEKLSPRLELHIFDVNQDLYDKEVEVEFLQQIRVEQKFDSLEELKIQIAKDVAFAENYFKPIVEEAMTSRCWTLFLTFFKIGAFTFGGGYAMIPMIEHEVVENHKWLTSDEVLDMFAIAETTPGVIAVNTATFVGVRVAGMWGALISTIAVSLPSVFTISLLSFYYFEFRNNEWVNYAFFGVRAGILVLIAEAFLRFGKKSNKNAHVFIVGVATVVLTLLNVNAVWLILAGALIGSAMYNYNLIKEKK